MNRREKRQGTRRERVGFRSPRVPQRDLPPPLAMILLDCTEGYIGRRGPRDVAQAIFPDRMPCDDCKAIIEAMSTQDLSSWPEARLTCEEKLCGHCSKLHKFWMLEEDVPGLLLVFKDKCTSWIVLRGETLCVITPPDICATCNALVRGWGRIAR